MALSGEKYKKQLLQRYKAGVATPEELQALFGLIGEEQFGKLLEQDMDDEIGSQLSSAQPNQATANKPWLRYFAAASVLLLLAAGIYLHQKGSVPGEEKQARVSATPTDIGPGANRAVLTLADGRKIDLNSASEGTISGQDGIQIFKSKSGQLIYRIAEQEQGQPAEEELSITPLLLPEGDNGRLSFPMVPPYG